MKLHNALKANREIRQGSTGPYMKPVEGCSFTIDDVRSPGWECKPGPGLDGQCNGCDYLVFIHTLHPYCICAKHDNIKINRKDRSKFFIPCEACKNGGNE